MMKAPLLPTTLLLTSLLLLTIPPTESFQTPIIFPLLWLSKQLTHQNNNIDPVALLPPSHRAARNRRRRRQQLPSISVTPILSALATKTASLSPDSKTKQREKQLLSWITQESSSDSSASTSNIRIDKHPKTQLRGLFAQRDIRSNELIVEVPYHVALLVGDTLRQDYPTGFDHRVDDHESWDEGDVEDVLQGLYFLENFVKGRSEDDSSSESHSEYDYELDCDYYAPYVTSLPPKPIDNHSYDKEEGLTPDFWSDSIIDEVGIPTYTQRILDRKRMIQTIAQNNNVDESELQWATFMIRSRRFTTWNMVPDPMYEEEQQYGSGPFGTFPTASIFNQKNIEQIQGFLVPLIDVANHTPNPNAEMKISVNKWTRKFDETSSFALHATRPLRHVWLPLQRVAEGPGVNILV